MGSGGASPSATNLFSPELNLHNSNGFFSRKTILFQGSRRGPKFPGGGGVESNFLAHFL